MKELDHIWISVCNLSRQNLLLFSTVSAVFAALGRVSRGVTNSGALSGAIVCFLLLWAGGFAAFSALLTLFVVTWASTRFGYTRTQQLGTAEAVTGRDSLQVVANLGIAALCSLNFILSRSPVWIVAMSAALAEAAADTVSSEIGQAVGGKPRLITTWRSVDPGTDGAVTLVGTVAGILAAALVGGVCWLAGLLRPGSAIICTAAAVGGMVADSVIGATLERRGVLGNNWVNFVSTAVAATIALFMPH